jgi:hypothetical protein
MKKYYLVLFVGLLFISCEKKTEDPRGAIITSPVPPPPPPPPPGDASMTVYKNGVEVSNSTPISKIIKYSSSSINHRTFSFKTFIGLDKLYLSVKNYDWQNPPEDGMIVKFYNSNTVNGDGEYDVCDDGDCDGAFMRYSNDSGTPFLETLIVSSGTPGVIEITYVDTINKVISGNFDATLYPTFTNSGDITTFSGEFENLPYSIQIW